MARRPAHPLRTTPARGGDVPAARCRPVGGRRGSDRSPRRAGGLGRCHRAGPRPESGLPHSARCKTSETDARTASPTAPSIFTRALVARQTSGGTPARSRSTRQRRAGSESSIHLISAGSGAIGPTLPAPPEVGKGSYDCGKPQPLLSNATYQAETHRTTVK